MPVIHSSNGGVEGGLLNRSRTAFLCGVAKVEFDILRRNVAEDRIFGGGEILGLASDDIAVSGEEKVRRALFQPRSVLEGRSRGRSGERGACDESY